MSAPQPHKPWHSLPAQGPILRPPEAAAYYGVSLSTYYELISAGVVPPFLKLSHKARASGVLKSWLDAAIAARVDAWPPPERNRRKPSAVSHIDTICQAMSGGGFVGHSR